MEFYTILVAAIRNRGLLLTILQYVLTHEVNILFALTFKR